ncbi:unnamed protein product [Spirodela intermedia]|uniref:Uncharacterized protein n=1 Tax=Spirodela intermedia TaxID=51605 RepID=A0A7I8J4W0_SPIIN|nr:unnamed protein product [Spirodela intermedia]CAA6665121.1 unnamed protein product [Spirodela intermedia]
MEATDREVASSPGWAHSRWFVVKSYIVKGGRGGAKAINLPPSPGKPLLRPENRENRPTRCEGRWRAGLRRKPPHPGGHPTVSSQRRTLD